LESAATAGATGAAAAAATLAQWVRGSNTESGTWAGIDIFHIDGATTIQKAFFYKKLDTVVLENLIVVLWLIQSQSQRGTGSATLHQGNAKGRFNAILLHVFLDF
jgi:hypothetical protein